MALNQNQIDIGQSGAIFITTAAYTAPTGKVICAIQFLSNSKFTSLTPVNSPGLRYLSVTADGTNANDTAAADGVGAKSFTAGGSGTEITAATNEFIYGRYSGVQLQAGSAIVYLLDE
tara:strand:+ start:248 stop:601 length:354 start_codon:yes stop_codon:yes gene_type:complete